jgi:hypothetical protein
MAETGMLQERTAVSFKWTVQAPQSALPHPNFVPLNPRISLKTHSRGISSSASTSCVFPFTWIEYFGITLIFICCPERESS